MPRHQHTKRIVEFWKIVWLACVHPEDAKVVKSYNHKAKSDRKLYVNNFSPAPWVGNLLKAKVIVPICCIKKLASTALGLIIE